MNTVTQTMLRTALLDADRPAPAGLGDGHDRPAGARFDVYRNNVVASLTQALHTGFPVVSRILGKENMDGLAGIYLRRYPPASPMMMFFGEGFPAFLESLTQLERFGYLGDVARLELALRRSYHAADAPPIAPADLAAIPPDALVATCLGLAPAVQVLRSRWPVHDIWRANTAVNNTDSPDPPRPVAQDVCIMRPGYDPTPVLLPAGGAEFIRALLLGHPLGFAHDQGQGAAPDFDAAAILALLLDGEAITSLTTKA